MESNNDNFENEESFLLASAQKVLDECGKPHRVLCPLMSGGPCPLLTSAMGSLMTVAKQQKD